MSEKLLASEIWCLHLLGWW